MRSDIEVGPEGLLTANMPDKGSGGSVALGIPGGRSQVARAAFGQLVAGWLGGWVAGTKSLRGVGIIGASGETINQTVRVAENVVRCLRSRE